MLKSVLVVDDDVHVQGLLTMMLTRLGFHVTSCHDGKQAVIDLNSKSFDILLTDIIMPDMDGYELIRITKSNHPGIFIVAMTGGGNFKADDYLKMAKPIGADAILEKPFTYDDIREITEDLIG